MTKRKISNIPFGPFITVLAGATVNGMDLSRVRQGVRDMKNVLDELSLNSAMRLLKPNNYAA